MTISIGNKSASSAALLNLNRSSEDLRSISERLSSGQRINKASDDSAGLSLAQALETDARVFNQAQRNVNDGISLLNIAEAALNELSGVVTRINELAIQAVTGTLSDKQREALDSEAQSLSQEFTRIVQSTEFNGMKLFDGSLSEGLTVQSGYGEVASIVQSLGKYLGSGDFELSFEISNPYTGEHAATGDLNGDGILDLVSGGSGGLNISLGNGDGSFTNGISIGQPGVTFEDIQLVDLNGDGILDIVGGGTTRGAALLLTALGNGDGTFAVSDTLTSTALTDGVDISIADLNSDGILDVVLGGSHRGSDLGFEVYYGESDGSLSLHEVETPGNPQQTIETFIADFDNDGVLDILALAGRVGDRGASAHLFTQNDLGFFSYDSEVASLSGPLNGVDLGDINQDGFLDFVVLSSDGGSTHSFDVYLNNGSTSTSFNLFSSTSLGSAGSDLFLSDLNGDGILDLFGGLHGKVWIGDGQGNFTATEQSTANPVYNKAYASADINYDGIVDLVGDTYIFSGTAREGLGSILEFSLGTRSGAFSALPVLGAKLQAINKQRSVIGAATARLQSAYTSVNSQALEGSAAATRINSVDVAEDTAKLLSKRILQQAGTAILAQANQSTRLSLLLLQAP